ncbi:hypothetical protein [Rhodanobacter sp. C05]|nr:hypothetical protein [Rhodanobacter sp. C05]
MKWPPAAFPGLGLRGYVCIIGWRRVVHVDHHVDAAIGNTVMVAMDGSSQ